MANGKKSFILYMDQRGVFDKLPDDKCAILIRHIYAYCADENPTTDDLIVEMAFEGIKQSLKRDLKKWRKQHRQRVKAGRKGGLARADNAKQSQAELSGAKQSQANQAVSVSDSVSANGSVARANSDLRFYCRTMFDDEQWQQSIRQVYPRLRKGDNLTLALNQFVSFCESAEKQHDDLVDCKGHFTKWMKHQKNTDIPGFK